MTDLTIIHQIEEILNIKLEKVNEISWNISGYSLNQSWQVTGLGLSDCKIKKIEKLISALQELKSLTTFSLHHNQISDISALQELTSLTTLYFSYNQILDISDLKALKSLTSLSLHHNQISDISVLQELKSLTSLFLGMNQISDISALQKLKNLTELYLFDNQISDISALKELYNKNNIKIDVSDNPLKNPPIEIVKQGKEAIRNYFEQLINKEGKEEKDYLYEAKLLLVGEERAGKSSIAEALTNAGFKIDFNKKSTYGIDILEWVIPKEKINTPRDFRFNIWDFGGQEIYHATHQFFLTRRSLYLFISEARKDIRFDDFYYWLNIINILAGDSPIMLVQNKTDQPHINQNIDEYRKRFSQITKELQTISCNTEHPDWENIYAKKLELLKETIYCILKEKKLPGIGDELPKTWVDIRREIKTMQDKKINYISLSDYCKICGKYNLNNEQALFLSDYFHDLGVFLYFRDDIQLKNTIFLNHEWVTHAIYNVLDCKKTITKHGKFTDKDLMEIWKVAEYKDKQAELLNLMKNKKFKICYQHEDGYYLAPQLFDDKPLDYEWRTTENNLRFCYEYEFMPKGILSQLIVSMNTYISKDVFWRYGVLFEYKDSRAIVIEDRFSKKNLISIQTEGHTKKELLTIIASRIEEINNSYSNLVITEKLGCCCPDCVNSNTPYLHEATDINRAIQKNRKTIECKISFEPVTINKLLGYYISEEKIGRYIEKTMVTHITNITNILGNENRVIQGNDRSDIDVNR